MIECVEGTEELASIEHFYDLIFPDNDGVLGMVYDAFIDDSRDRLVS